PGSSRDKAAQATVSSKWYDGRCLLSGGGPAVGAHIVDVTASGMHALNFWNTLQIFWPLEKITELAIGGQELQNILPLRVDARDFWDRHRFALRPIAHPTDPEHSMYLQVVWLNDLDKRGGLARGAWDHGRRGTIVDFRRRSADDGTFPNLEHGDVYQLSTADPDGRPLPHMRFLEMRFAVQKLMAGPQAEGALAVIFGGGEPPAESGRPGPALNHDDDDDDDFLRSDWKVLLEAAVEAKVIDSDAADRWARSIRREAYDGAMRRAE
ncbi:hypothetical protein B0T24DRAFT_501782, partial [Lasiosphaeria ovina]